MVASDHGPGVGTIVKVAGVVPVIRENEDRYASGNITALITIMKMTITLRKVMIMTKTKKSIEHR